MEAYPLLNDFLLLLAVSIPVSFLFNRLKLPSIIGFLATGMIVGPFGLRLIADLEAIGALAELGVVLLLFTIGLEFSLRELLSGSTRILAVAGLQVVGTVATTSLGTRLLGLPTHQTIFLGFLVALSSTVIVLKILADRAELDTPQGRISITVLLFQDICIIPMMLLIPNLSSGDFDFLAIARQLFLAMLAVGGLILAARYAVPLLLKQIVNARSRELFLVSILVVCLGTAYISAHLGLTLAIGAFIAGLVISESSYSHQILSDILPLRDIFNAVFFISVGMLLDLGSLFSSFGPVTALAFGIFVLKAIVVFLVLFATKHSVRVSVIAAFSLAQVGEFSFLLALEGRKYGLLGNDLYQMFLSSAVLTMFFTPFAISMAGRIALRLQQWFGETKEWAADENVSEVLKNHLIIIGFGLNGKNLSQVVRGVGIPFVVIELNHELIRQAKQDGIPVLFGDATSQEVLLRAGAAEARMVVIAISDAAATRRCVAVLRSLNRSGMILVRTRYVAEVETLMRLGANEVIPEEFETSIEIFARVLAEYRIPEHLIVQQISVIRSAGYGMLRGLSLTEERLTQISELFLKSTIEQVVVRRNSPADKKTLRELNLRKTTGTTILAVIRNDQAHTNPSADMRLEENDVLVLWGAHKELAEAERMLSPDRGQDTMEMQAVTRD